MSLSVCAQNVLEVAGASVVKRSVNVNITQVVTQSQESVSVYLAGLDTPVIKVINSVIPSCVKCFETEAAAWE